MNVLVSFCKPEPDFHCKTLFRWNFEHDAIKTQKEESAFFVVAVLSHYATDFYFTSVISVESGSDNIDFCDAWINNGFAALSSLKKNFNPDTWKEILDLAYDIALNEYCDENVANNIKEYYIL